MQLTKDNIASYLIDKGFIEMTDQMAGKWQWKITKGRNIIFIFRNLQNQGFFIKQPSEFNLEQLNLIQKDATVQYLFFHTPEFEIVSQHIPQYLGYDADHHVLFMEYIPFSKTLLEITENNGSICLDQAKEMTDILLAFHLDIDQLDQQFSTLRFFDQKPPWIIDFPNTENFLNDGVLQLIRQDELVIDNLGEMLLGWERKSIIHGDVKLLNFINSDANGKAGIWLIDWELANIGDPLWDVAGLLQSYLVSGIANMLPNETGLAIPSQKQYWSEPFVEKAWHHIWQHYAKSSGWSDDLAVSNLIKTIKLTAARILQSAVELNQVCPEYLAPRSVVMFNTAKKLFLLPEQLIQKLSQPIQSVA